MTRDDLTRLVEEYTEDTVARLECVRDGADQCWAIRAILSLEEEADFLLFDDDVACMDALDALEEVDFGTTWPPQDVR